MHWYLLPSSTDIAPSMTSSTILFSCGPIGSRLLTVLLDDGYQLSRDIRNRVAVLVTDVSNKNSYCTAALLLVCCRPTHVEGKVITPGDALCQSSYHSELELATIQQQHYLFLSSRCSSKWWLNYLIKKLWDIAWDLWNHRNGKQRMPYRGLIERQLIDSFGNLTMSYANLLFSAVYILSIHRSFKKTLGTRQSGFDR